MKFQNKNELLEVFGKQQEVLRKMYSDGFYPRYTIQGYLVPPETYDALKESKGRGIVSIPRLELTHDLLSPWAPASLVVRPLEGVHEDSCNSDNEAYLRELVKSVEKHQLFSLAKPMEVIENAVSERGWRFFWKGRWKATRVYGFNEKHPSAERLEVLQKKGKEDQARVGRKEEKKPLSYELKKPRKKRGKSKRKKKK